LLDKFTKEISQINDNSFEFVMPDTPTDLTFKQREAFPKKARQKFLNNLRKTKKELLVAVPEIYLISLQTLETNDNPQIVFKTLGVFVLLAKLRWPQELTLNLDPERVFAAYATALTKTTRGDNFKGLEDLLNAADAFSAVSDVFANLNKSFLRELLKSASLPQAERIEIDSRAGGYKIMSQKHEIHEKTSYLSRVLLDAWTVKNITSDPIATHLYETLSFWIKNEYGLSVAEENEPVFNPELHENKDSANITTGETVRIVEPAIFLTKDIESKIFKKAKVVKP
jgi:hypothetical protein